MTIQSLYKLYNWQGATPSDWVLEPMRYCVALRQNGDWGDEPDDEEGIYCLRAADFEYDKLDLKDKKSFAKRKYSAARFNKVKLKPGDLLVEKSGGGEKVPVGRAVLFCGQFEACFSNFLERICVLPNVSPRFFFYWWTAGYQSLAFVPYFNQTTGIQNLNSRELLSRCSIALPLLDEQERISDVIDAQCSLMNKSIATLSKEVDVLEHYRASIIHEAVTKGLNSDVPMKPSGVDWIGDIPEKWQLKRIKFMFDTSSGVTPESSNWDLYDGGINWIQSGDLYTQHVITETGRTVSNKALSEVSALKIYKAPFVVMAMYGASIGNVSISKIDACTNQACCVMLPKEETTTQYLFYALMDSQACLKYKALGGTQPNISQVIIRNHKIPVPSKDEQVDIVDYLDTQTAVIDSILGTKRKQINVLKRCRQSLIYEYVTGKRRVRKEM